MTREEDPGPGGRVHPAWDSPRKRRRSTMGGSPSWTRTRQQPRSTRRGQAVVVKPLKPYRTPIRYGLKPMRNRMRLQPCSVRLATQEGRDVQGGDAGIGHRLDGPATTAGHHAGQFLAVAV